VALNDLLYGVTHGGFDQQGVYQRAAIYTLQPPDSFRIIGRVGNRTGGAPGGELTAVNGNSSACRRAAEGIGAEARWKWTHLATYA
jgi:hypothetical protein